VTAGRGLAALIAVAGLLPMGSADAAASGTYVRERAGASWTVPAGGPRRVIVYSVVAASYTDVATGDTVQRAEVTRARCRLTSGGSRSCGAGTVQVVAVPKAFDVADDLASAALEVVAGGRTFTAAWSAHPATSPGSFPPTPEEYSESCPEGTGEGKGLYRRMQASARLFDAKLGARTKGDVDAWADRVVLTTECPPEDTPLSRAAIGACARACSPGAALGSKPRFFASGGSDAGKDPQDRRAVA
jgi:hypothetical protein